MHSQLCIHIMDSNNGIHFPDLVAQYQITTDVCATTYLIEKYELDEDLRYYKCTYKSRRPLDKF